MLNTFLNFVLTNKLFSKRDKILATVSGGVDSVVLVDLLFQGGFNFAIAHCNFQLRGKESDDDELFVKELAAKMEVPFFRAAFDIKTQVEKDGVSTQMAARNVRYDWFEKLRTTLDYHIIATAHHKNDSLETVLYNLTKGTGLAGLHGIKPKINHLVRPLLFATKDEIKDYALQCSLSWREDSSNASNKYHRNLIRNEVIPLLRKINPNLETTFETTLDRLQATDDFFTSQVDAIKNIILERREDDYWLSIKTLKKYAGIEVVLHHVLGDFGFNYHQVKQIIQSFDAQSGKVFHSVGYVLNVDRFYLVISPVQDEFSERLIYDGLKPVIAPGFKLVFEEFNSDNFSIDRSINCACIDLDRINFPIALRSWQKGDWFIPLGMTKKKKLSDFMIDEKIPVNLKSRTFVLTANNNIFWVVGHRIDNRYKITNSTRRILKIVKKPNNDD